MQFKTIINKTFSRYFVDIINKVTMFILLLSVVCVPIIIGTGLLLKSLPLFEGERDIFDILFSSSWQPSEHIFGFLSFIVSSLYITGLSILIAAPVCLLISLHLLFYANDWFISIFQPFIDILAGLPSIIYGVWGILVIVPLVSDFLAPLCNVSSSGFSMLSAAIVLSIMIIPFILNILIEILQTVPKELIEAGLSLGSTRWEVIKFIVLRKIQGGIVSAFALGIARAFGETIAVLMVAGNVLKLPESIFSAAYPIPALIANNYGEMMSIPLYDSALMFAALLLFIIVLVFNLIARSTIHQLSNR